MKEFKTDFDKIKVIVDLWFKRLYIVCFNFYAWFWLYRQIFIRHSNDFEEYTLWAFMTFGMYYFVLDSDDVFFKPKNNNTQK